MWYKSWTGPLICPWWTLHKSKPSSEWSPGPLQEKAYSNSLTFKSSNKRAEVKKKQKTKQPCSHYRDLKSGTPESINQDLLSLNRSDDTPRWLGWLSLPHSDTCCTFSLGYVGCAVSTGRISWQCGLNGYSLKILCSKPSSSVWRCV